MRTIAHGTISAEAHNFPTYSPTMSPNYEATWRAPAITKSICDKLEAMRRRDMLDGSYVEEFPSEDDKVFLAANGLPIAATD